MFDRLNLQINVYMSWNLTTQAASSLLSDNHQQKASAEWLPRKITLYDVEFTFKENPLSPYSIRLMLLLHYKNLAYETVWISFPHVEATAKALSAPPTFTKADGTLGYTIPFVTASFPDKSTIAISDSLRIAQFIDKMYPEPEDKIILSNARVFHSIFTKYMTERIQGSIYKISMPFAINALSESAGKCATEAWKVIKTAFDDLAVHLDNGGERNFRVTGNAGYAEFELVSILNLVKRLSRGGWNRLRVRNGGRWGKLTDLLLYKKLLPANRV
ncbi:hypothetical protein ACEPAI_6905 [Sanghuangporus weigelae]